ncbi:hypothetical protein [Halovenus sp. HT40]|uniref:hypothetical protein n=1 Tax=Halovenus sp. HT40 TaxID=3126691 RepID=UPI00300F0BDF
MTSGFVETFREIDSGLRIIVTFANTDWEIEYIRDDLEETYTEEEFEKTYREHLASQLASENLSAVIEGGEFVGEMFLFEDIVVFQFPSSRYEGMFVSYDWTESFPTNDVFAAADELPTIE